MAKVRRDRWGHWQWQASLKATGYGEFTMGGRGSSVPAHRAAWLLFCGPIPEGHQIHHVCLVRSCVNPAHLMVVTPMENTRECRIRKGRVEVCKHGHPMDDDNVGWTTRSNGRTDRYCRACQYASNRRSYATHIEARRAYARERRTQSLAEELSAIVAEDLRRTQGRCVGCQALMPRPVRRHGDLPLWFCSACRASDEQATQHVRMSVSTDSE